MSCNHNRFWPDLDLPNWGPYGKEFVGVSRIADMVRGHRWDCFLLPGFHRRAVIGPYGRRENRWFYRSAETDLSSYELRYQLEWKDRVFVDLRVDRIAEETRLLTATCVNRTDLPQSIDLHLALTLTPNAGAGGRAVVSNGAVWTGALEFFDIRLPNSPHRVRQVADALRPGECLHPELADGRGLGATFFCDRGAVALYRLDLVGEVRGAVCVFSYYSPDCTAPRLRVRWGSTSREVIFAKTGEGLSQLRMELGDLPAGSFLLELEVLAGGNILLDGFAIGGSDVGLKHEKWLESRAPGISWDVPQRRMELKYTGISGAFTILAPHGAPMRRRTVIGDDVPAIVSDFANDHVLERVVGVGARHTETLVLGPVTLDPGSSEVFEWRVALGEPDMGDAVPPASRLVRSNGQKILESTLCMNVVYPVRHRDVWVRHFTPGRWWDSLYTWDSGMIGMGLSTMDAGLSMQTLDQYLMPPGDPYAAFVEHGTPLPTLAWQAETIWERTGDAVWLRGVYPRLKQYYEWLAGRTRASTTDRFQTGLLQTWDYFYNSGGWDDYPPQKFLTSNPERRARVAPCVTTSHAIVFARIMLRFANALSATGDQSTFASDVERWTRALLDFAWDPDSGFFAYVEHDSEGRFLGILRDEDGQNFNLGLDGVTPLLVEGLPREVREKLVMKLFDERELWTEWGLSTVSRSAPFYRSDGYWNGAVWIAHHYFFWRALRSAGHCDKASRLARSVIGCWEREVSASGGSFENFRVATGRGAGWHQFGGLNAALLLMMEQEGRTV